MKIKLFYDLWQLECCGKPFKVGDEIIWLVTPADGYGESLGIKDLDYFYEAHSDTFENIFRIKGKIKSIALYYVKYKLDNKDGRNIYVQIPNTSKLVNTTSSDFIEDRNLEKPQMTGYVIELDNVEVKLANNN